MKLFIDMDGTLAEWKSGAAPEELLEEGYFFNLAPLNAVQTTAMLAGKNTYILSAVIPHGKYATADKLKWLAKYLPEIPRENILFSVDGGSKRQFVKEKFGKVTRQDILLDDYSKNLDDWALEGTSVKYLNGLNAKRGRTYQYAVSGGGGARGAVQNALFLRNLMEELGKDARSACA